MKAENLAIVIGRTIHLHNTNRQRFLENKVWLRHEVAHVYQWQQLGNTRFVIQYLLESFRNGYYKNRFEIEAREKEKDGNILNNILVV